MKTRDRDLDGTPDEFRPKPFHSYEGDEVLENGFIRVRQLSKKDLNNTFLGVREPGDPIPDNDLAGIRQQFAVLLGWDATLGLATQALLPQ